ncbi:hypothetical protein [Nocardioides marmotae]|uniref:hypothetical protein n=1 Tax=Nocardioides marmotae TaxID=2663857 RepID=UPI00149552E4|nr:hypothetical protein [Nocardioides marmotae]QKE01791.1 hypothetical protein HPC71_12475 [Nocardioides marmotae]
MGELGDAGDGSAFAAGSVSLPPHAESPTNTVAPVAQEISPSRIFMVSNFLSPFGVSADDRVAVLDRLRLIVSANLDFAPGRFRLSGPTTQVLSAAQQS